MRSDIKIKQPTTNLEFKEYYDLRWRILRKPWDMPQGSEQDELDGKSIHLMAIIDNKLIGCGRGHLASYKVAQIRYMAVDEHYRRQGVASNILLELEKILFNKNVNEIILKAREKAVPFYTKFGYEIFEEGEILFDQIKHYWMKKYEN